MHCSLKFKNILRPCKFRLRLLTVWWRFFQRVWWSALEHAISWWHNQKIQYLLLKLCWERRKRYYAIWQKQKPMSRPSQEIITSSEESNRIIIFGKITMKIMKRFWERNCIVWVRSNPPAIFWGWKSAMIGSVSTQLVRSCTWYPYLMIYCMSLIISSSNSTIEI